MYINGFMYYFNKFFFPILNICNLFSLYTDKLTRFGLVKALFLFKSCLLNSLVYIKCMCIIVLWESSPKFSYLLVMKV